ncbi:hypothetical protein AK812_SmicGene13742 [Symbiodinium microadriaticum]|uniref:Uncharacterized protein n=1 Tax=Symbiodinium microadriaticum TaxID=2951 RepID=A0A1Q9E7D0_SYMMI|nr:hypothetical protein AK812_SmicGene13742 [Symbiodinium microadriaticum]
MAGASEDEIAQIEAAKVYKACGLEVKSLRGLLEPMALRGAGYDASEVQAAGHSFAELRRAGYGAQELHKLGCRASPG